MVAIQGPRYHLIIKITLSKGVQAKDGKVVYKIVLVVLGYMPFAHATLLSCNGDLAQGWSHIDRQAVIVLSATFTSRPSIRNGHVMHSDWVKGKLLGEFGKKKFSKV